MKNCIILLISLVSTVAICSAAPAKHVKRVLKLEDGSTVEATLTGDEHCHWYVDDSGKILTVDTMDIAHYISSEVKTKMQIAGAVRAKSVNIARQVRLGNISHAKTATMESQNTCSYTGEKKGLVILINFQDMAFTHTNEEISELTNQRGYCQNGSIGSVSDYFYDQSYGQFNLNFDVCGPYTLSHNMKYYGQNNSMGEDVRPASMITEACQLADADVDFSTYDWNHDGEVDQVYVMYAGYSKEQGGSANCIWSHEWNLNGAYEENPHDGNGAIKLDGCTINTYACNSELSGATGTRLNGIGTMCHEFSHCLGLPDEYDTNSKNFAMNSWSVMAHGQYGKSNGYIPTGYTSYERWTVGWLTPTELTDSREVTDMHSIANTPEAYIIYNDKNRNEYYMLENRQPTGWDQDLEGHGMFVLHVDYDEGVWKSRTINADAYHQRMTIIAADNIYSSQTLSGDPFPGTSNKTELTNTSIPAATLYNYNTDNTKLMSKPITNITENNDGLISFTFTNPNPTGIEEIESIVMQKTTNKVYSIAGQYIGTDVNNMPNGIYIQNGKLRICK